MNILDFLDYDREELSPEFKNAMDYSDKYLQGLNDRRDIEPQLKKQDITSMSDAEQAITDTITYIASEGSKTMDSTQMAVLVKGLSDLRTILTSGDMAKDNMSEPEEQDAAHEEEKEQPITSGGGDGNAPASKHAPTPEAVNTLEDLEEKSNIWKLIKMAESYISWSQTRREMDSEQLAYLSQLKGLVKGFDSLEDLLVFLISYTSEGHGRMTNSMFVFLLIIYISEMPERYLNLFLTNPIEYSENCLTNKRSYEYDDVFTFYEMQKVK